MAKAKILIVDDETDIRALISDILGDEGFAVAQAAHSEAAFAAFTRDRPDLVILDIWLENSDRDGMQILAELKRMAPDLPVLMISGHGNIEMAVKAIRLGAFDFIEKPFNTDRLLLQIRRALEAAHLRRENTTLKNVAALGTRVAGSSGLTKNLLAAARKAAEGEGRILITGPRGTGRSTLARLIHSQSARALQPLYVQDCRTLQPDALANVFQTAQAATLLLENLGHMSSETQAALLQAIAGKPDIRIISIADTGFRENAVHAGFKGDLQARLSVVALETAPLADRSAEIAEIAADILAAAAERSGDAAPFTVDDGALLALKCRTWPGNIEELKLTLELAALKAAVENRKTITASDLEGSDNGSSGSPLNLELDMRSAREDFEKRYLEAQLARFDGNISLAAAHVGMDRTALHRKLKALAGEGEEAA